uniref:Uncharacterized protein n=1 Tax=Aegilops tauschii TaxID=37682 RepID=M8CBV6_AEGTA
MGPSTHQGRQGPLVRPERWGNEDGHRLLVVEMELAGPDGSGTALIGASVATVLRVEADPQRRWRCVKPARASARGTTWLSGDEMLVHLLLTDQIAEDSSSTDAPKERISNATIAAQHSRRARAGLLNPTALLGRFMSQAAAEGEIQVERAISIAATRPPVCVSPPLLL